MRRSLLVVLLSAFVASAAYATEGPPPALQPAPDPDLTRPNRTYQLCLLLAHQEPEKGIELAGKWVGLGGGEPAKHCQALSLIGLKEYGEGARRLEEIAQTSQQDSTVRASMLAQAGQAWLLQGETSRAYAAQSLALKIVPQGSKQNMEILLDRAGTLAEAEKYKEVIDDVNAALHIDPNNAEALAYRASAHRLMDDMDEALADAERAVKANPANVSALLERGNVYRMKKRLNDARKDWMRILELEPDSAAADAARTNIERIDVDPYAH